MSCLQCCPSKSYFSFSRLLVAQYPHLCIIEDWLEETVKTKTIESTSHTGDKACTIQQFRDGMFIFIQMHSDWPNQAFS